MSVLQQKKMMGVTNVYFVGLESFKEIYHSTLPLPQKQSDYYGDVIEYRITCSVDVLKNGTKMLVTVSKAHFKPNSFFYILNMESNIWTLLRSKIDYFGAKILLDFHQFVLNISF